MDLTSVSDATALQGRPRVVLADDHRVVLVALQGVLRGAVDVVATATTGKELLSVIAEATPDVVISDFQMPDGTGLDALKCLRRKGASTPFLMLSMYTSLAVVSSCMRAGANGYVLKSARGGELIAAVGLVLRGRTYISPALSATDTAPTREPSHRATPRQLQILKLTALGLSTRKIGEQLSLSPRTVEAHKFNLMTLLNVKTSLELVRRARELGLFF
jgi:DNA-binding NarL/FixJ family response regulator